MPDDVLYTIVAGDSPAKVADLFGIDVDTLIELNTEVSRTFLVGQVLRLPPGSTVVDPQEQLHVVAEGDSLASIAERYDIAVETLVSVQRLARGPRPSAVRWR